MTNDMHVRRATAADDAAIRVVTGSSFGRVFPPDARTWWRELFPFDSSLVAVSNGTIIGHTAVMPMSLTVPGPRQVAAAGVSSVAVAATHRRKGVMRALFTEMHEQVAAAGTPLAILTASEGGIYSRYGYCTATLEHSIVLDRRFAEFSSAAPDPGGVSIVDIAAAQAELKAVYERWQAITPGAQARPDADWKTEFADLPDFRDGGTELFALLHPDGYALYRYLRQEQRLRVESLRAVTTDAYCALWRTLIAFDLFDTIEAAVPPGDLLPYLLTNPRLVRTTSRHDELWLRIMDVPAALAARGYLADLDVVLEISDDFRDDGGRFALRVRDGVAECTPSSAEPDARLGLDVLSGLYLGTHAPAAFAAANRLHVRDAATLGALRAAFASAREPQLGWGF